MEKEVVWTDIAKNDLKNKIYYLEGTWPTNVLDNFTSLLHLKNSATIETSSHRI